MKKRRFAIAAFLLCACLVVGIGFAAITTNLQIDTYINLGVNNAAFDVHFDSVSGTADNGTYASDNSTADGTYSAAIRTGALGVDYRINAGVLNATGDNVVFTSVIVNGSEAGTFDASLIAANAIEVQANTSTGLFNYVNANVEYSADGATGTINSDGTVTLAPGETIKVVMTVTLDVMPVDPITNAHFTITIPASAVTLAD